jgi:hypothetical protein
LSAYERMSLSTEACDYLFRLRNLGIIDGRQFETILARAIPVGAEKVHVDDVKDIACTLLFDSDAGDLDEDAPDRTDSDVAPA